VLLSINRLRLVALFLYSDPHIEGGLGYRLMLCFKFLHKSSMGSRQVMKLKAASAKIFQEVAFIRLAILLSHEPVSDPLYKIPIFHIPLVSSYIRLGGMSTFFFAFLFPSLSFHLTAMFIPMLYSVFVLSRLFFFSLTRGASSPEWVKPAAEGGLSSICFLFICLLFVICSSVICLLLFLST
jgi:hypothetical protein